MSDTVFSVDLEGNIFIQMNKINNGFENLEGKAKKVGSSATSAMGSLKNQIKSISLVSITQGFENLSRSLGEIAAPGLKFNSGLAELSALTGVTGKGLQDLGKYARESAQEFGGNAAASLDNYKVLLSRLGPGIAQNQKALVGMEKNVQILSKTMGGDTVGAVDALTTAMLQYGVDLSKPEEAQRQMAIMMDVMANAAQEGAAEVPQISAALKVAGVAATQAKVSFAETNSAIQALAQGGKEGAEAGMALRNILGKMAGEDVIPKEAADKLKKLGVDMNIVSNTALPFTDRLRELKKAQGDATIMAQVFGVENAAAANILLGSVDAQDELTVAIQKQGGAQKQANIVMEYTEEKVARMQAKIEGYKIAVFEMTGGTIAYLQPLSDVVRQFSAFGPLVNSASGIVDKLRKSTQLQTAVTKTVTIVQKLWNLAMASNPIGLIITGVALLATGLYALTRSMKDNTVSAQANADVTKRVKEAMVDERVELDMLFKQLKATNPKTAERTKLVKELTDKYPDLLKGYDLENMKAKELDVVQKRLIDNIRNRITAEIKGEKAKELLKEAEEVKSDGVGALTGKWYTNKAKYGYIKELEDKANSLISESIDIQNKGAKKTPAEAKVTKNPDFESPNTEETPAVINGLSTTPPKTTETTATSGSGGGSTTVDKRNITVRIDRLVENLTISTTNLKEGLADAKKQVAEALIGAVRDFEVAI